MYPKTEPESPDRHGSITVIKSLYDSSGKRMIVPAEGTEFVFYVGLFTDEACTQRVPGTGDLPLRFSGNGQASATFSNLPVGVTYYIAETDGAGNVVSSVKKDGVTFTAVYTDGQAVTLTKSQPDGTIEFRNDTPKLPPKYYYGGVITITKKMVASDGSEYKSDDIWYAGIFTDEKYTERVGDVIELSMNGESSVSVEIPVSIGTDEKDSVTYYITETDQNGVPLDNSGAAGFTYTLSKDGGKVELNVEQSEDEIVITNTFTGQKTPTPAPSLTPSASDTPTPGISPSVTPGSGITVTPGTDGGSTVTPAPGGGTSTTTPTKTGDSTPVGFWIALALAAAAVVSLAVYRLKKEE